MQKKAPWQQGAFFMFFCELKKSGFMYAGDRKTAVVP